jgi:uncharacterized protein YndB with AHSA1/START domain
MQDTIERQVTVRASKERVFEAITQPDQIIKWFPDAVEGKLEVGERPVFDFAGYGKAAIYVTAVDPYHYFAYRWVPGETAEGEDALADVLAQPNTLVEFRLEESADGTVVKLKESGFASLPSQVYEKKFGDNTEGWEYMFGRLEKLFAQD